MPFDIHAFLANMEKLPPMERTIKTQTFMAASYFLKYVGEPVVHIFTFKKVKDMKKKMRIVNGVVSQQLSVARLAVDDLLLRAVPDLTPPSFDVNTEVAICVACGETGESLWKVVKVSVLEGFVKLNPYTLIHGPPGNVCANCRNEVCKDELCFCSGCKAVKYCSKECQVPTARNER